MIGMQAVADTVGVSRATLRRRITAGRFPAPARFSRRSLRWRVATLEEWLTDNAERGRLKLLARELGGVQDPEPLSFMSTHPKAYRQLAEPGVAEAIAAMERRLNSGPARWYIPEDRIASVAERIQDGDLIAATSTLAGLDIAHTGIALWQGGQLYLLHAPLVGKSVEISALPLAQRILDLKAQDGIMVARVLR